MKKIMLVSVVLLALFTFVGSSFADTVNNESAGAGTSIDLDGTGSLILNFSPGVFGQYTTEGTTTNEQWYSIGTYHGGGDYLYATSQQQTVIWKADRDTPDTFTTIAIPATETNSQSEDQWKTAGFTR